MKINKDLEIALKALTILKINFNIMRTADIAANIGHNIPHLEQIMRKLKNASLVSVKRGPGGGYTSSPTPHTALEVSTALGYKMKIIGEPDSPENALSLALINAFESTYV